MSCPCSRACEESIGSCAPFRTCGRQKSEMACLFFQLCLVDVPKTRYLYTRFVHLLVSDTEYILDSAFSTLASIASIEKLSDDAAAWNALGEAEKRAKEEELRSGVSRARGLCLFSSSLVEMLSFLTSLDLEPLLCDELRDKVFLVYFFHAFFFSCF